MLFYKIMQMEKCYNHYETFKEIVDVFSVWKPNRSDPYKLTEFEFLKHLTHVLKHFYKNLIL